ncbi:MAG: hypothetical protein KF764_21740 [Labilithrix sp.]|nr:hypothetical protein [Labilithrix sp.]MBX3221881.1 hypothetical protein [Labilithrix sp.]
MKTLPTPFPPEWTVREARDAYLAENGFTVEAYDEKWTGASFFGIPFKVPNTRRHRWAIMLHDLHHVATGYGTDLVGEGEISAWELRPGPVSLGLYVGGIVFLGTLAGAFVAPRRTLAAWRAARSIRTLHDQLPATADEGVYEALLGLTVAELRERLGVPRAGLAREPRRLHDYAPAA